jgi:hypothetical protein
MKGKSLMLQKKLLFLSFLSLTLSTASLLSMDPNQHVRRRVASAAQIAENTAMIAEFARSVEPGQPITRFTLKECAEISHHCALRGDRQNQQNAKNVFLEGCRQSFQNGGIAAHLIQGRVNHIEKIFKKTFAEIDECKMP